MFIPRWRLSMPEFGIKVTMTSQDEGWVKALSRQEAEKKVLEAIDEEGELLVWEGHEQ